MKDLFHDVMMKHLFKDSEEGLKELNDVEHVLQHRTLFLRIDCNVLDESRFKIST